MKLSTVKYLYEKSIKEDKKIDHEYILNYLKSFSFKDEIELIDVAEYLMEACF